MSSAERAVHELGYCLSRVHIAYHELQCRTVDEILDVLWDEEDSSCEPLACMCEMKKQLAEIEAQQALAKKRDALKKETLRLISDRMCLKCTKAERNVVGVPCCHLVMCEACIQKETHCVCGEEILQTILVFM